MTDVQQLQSSAGPLGFLSVKPTTDTGIKTTFSFPCCSCFVAPAVDLINVTGQDEH